MRDTDRLQSDIQTLKDGAENQRRNALQSLGLHDQKAWATVPLDVKNSLIAALHGQQFKTSNRLSVQKEMATILGNLGPLTKSSVPQLIELLGIGIHDFVRGAAVAALGEIGKDANPAVSRLVQLLATSRPALSLEVIRALGNIGCVNDEVRSVLLGRWASRPQDEHNKEQLATALCKLHIYSDNVLSTLTTALTAGQYAGDRRAAAAALAWCDAEELDVVPALLKANVSDTNAEVRETARSGLAHMGLSHEQAIDLCARRLGDSLYAESALRKCGQSATPALIEALASTELPVRLKALCALEGLGEGAVAAISPVSEALFDKSLDVRLAALKALWSITKSAERVVPGLIALLEAKTVAKLEESETRRRFLQTVMEALRRVEPPATAAVSVLTTMTKDLNRHVRESAIITLQKIVTSAEGVGQHARGG